VYVVGLDDSNSDIKYDVVLKDEFIEENKLITNKTVEVFGKQYEVTYDETRKGYLYNNDVEIYKYDGDTYVIIVHFSSKNGDIVKCGYIEKKYENTSEIKTKEECLDIAKKYISNYSSYADDIEQYQLVDENKIGGTYSFYFCRFINGMKTIDGIRIDIYDNGSISSIGYSQLGCMKDAELPDESTLSGIRNQVNDKLDEIYGDTAEVYTVNYLDWNETFIRLTDGEYALRFDVKVESVSSNPNVDSLYKSHHFIVYLD
jgi:hypothetical protein